MHGMLGMDRKPGTLSGLFLANAAPLRRRWISVSAMSWRRPTRITFHSLSLLRPWGTSQLGVSAFDPIQNASSCRSERRHIFRKQ